MSRNIRRSLGPALALAILAGAGLSRSAEAQTPEQALLNRIPAPPPSALDSAQMSEGNPIDGERALLGVVEGSAGPKLLIVIQVVPVDGERALLGRWPAAQPRRPEDWALVP
ncbi:MAG TPA: hypothetical protein VFB61_06755 [Gemmatimonadales bacterium]|nr:hypothetical protein [Gemmatimonadales bacterium]